MKRQILNLEGVAVLTKEQQKMVNGGTGTCAYRTSFVDADGVIHIRTVRGVSQAEAFNAATSMAMDGGSGNWCCDSCGSASWY